MYPDNYPRSDEHSQELSIFEKSSLNHANRGCFVYVSHLITLNNTQTVSDVIFPDSADDFPRWYAEDVPIANFRR